jgi:hypothetical protein
MSIGASLRAIHLSFSLNGCLRRNLAATGLTGTFQLGRGHGENTSITSYRTEPLLMHSPIWGSFQQVSKFVSANNAGLTPQQSGSQMHPKRPTTRISHRNEEASVDEALQFSRCIT